MHMNFDRWNRKLSRRNNFKYLTPAFVVRVSNANLLQIKSWSIIYTSSIYECILMCRLQIFEFFSPILKYNIKNNSKVTCLITCPLLYWPKIHRIFVNFSFLWHRVSFFLFSSIKIVNFIYEKTRKKKGKRFGHIWGPSSVP